MPERRSYSVNHGRSKIMKTLKQGLLTAALLPIIITFVHTSMTTYAGSTEPEISSVPDQAVVIFYREKKLKGSAANHKTYLNDAPLALLSNGTWAEALMQPGNYDLWIELYNPQGLISRAFDTFQCEANQVYYLKLGSYFISDGLTWRANATLMDELTARREISGLQKVKNLE
jgi:hypothetical protein